MSGNRLKDIQKLETGWDNRLTIGPINLRSNQHSYGTIRASVSADTAKDDSRIGRAGSAYEMRPKPLTAYSSISTTLGFKHHKGTDELKELAVVRSILAREGVLLKLQNLCDKISKCDVLVQSSMILESELLDTLALMRTTTMNFTESLSIWRDSATKTKLQNPRVFEWEDQNYTLKIINDLDFLADQPVLLASLKLTKSTMKSNPLMLSNTLEHLDLHTDPERSASIDSGGQSDGEVFLERLRIRKAEKIILIEKSLFADSSSRTSKRGKCVLSQMSEECKNDEQNEMAQLIALLDALPKSSGEITPREGCGVNEVLPLNRSLSASSRFCSALEFSALDNDRETTSSANVPDDECCSMGVAAITADDLENVARIADPCPRLILAGAATVVILWSIMTAQDQKEVRSMSHVLMEPLQESIVLYTTFYYFFIHFCNKFFF
jgi:hypothetical protein